MLATIGLLLLLAGAGDLGADLRDFPEPHPRRGGVRGRVGAVDRLFHPHVHLSRSSNAGLGIAGTFWLYAGICAAGFVFILLRVPETKGKTLEQIERELVD